jgi:hypothetical protein
VGSPRALRIVSLLPAPGIPRGMEAGNDADQVFAALVLLRATSGTALDLLGASDEGEGDLASALAELNVRLDERLSRPGA